MDFDVTRWEWQVFFALVVLWLLVVFVPGRLRGEAKKRVEVLGSITGVFLEPRYFEEIQRAGRRSGLGGELSMQGVEIDDPAKMRAAAARASGELLARIYTFARYSAVDHAE